MKLRKRFERFAAIAAVAASAATAVAAPVAFTGTQTVMADEVVSLSKNSVEMKNGTFDVLIARVNKSGILDKILVWDSSDPKVARVTGGIVRAAGEGTAVITAMTRDGKYMDSCRVVVTNGDSNFTGAIMGDMVVGGRKAVKDIKAIADLAKAGVKFVMENEKVATIKNGVITAVKEGTTKLFAVAADGTKTLIGTINVIKEKIPVAKIVVDSVAANIKEGATKKINALIEPFNASDKTIIWSSDNPAIAKVVDGVITGVKAGTTKIKAMTPDGSKITEIIVTVAKAVAKDGWVKENGSWYYYRMGDVYKGWHWMTSSDGEKTPHWSYFGPDGKLRTGWVRLGAGDGESVEHWSYFGPDGWLRTGWQRMSTSANPDGNTPEHYSYFGPNGWLRTGWQKMGKGTSNPDGNNPVHNSYFGSNGWLRTGKQTIDGKVYIFDARGWQQ